jgi:hypothetical protein
VKEISSNGSKFIILIKTRSRLDILTVVSYLCTRVSVAMEEDATKLHHLLGHLNYTREKSLILKPQGILTVEAHIDAAFCISSGFYIAQWYCNIYLRSIHF